MSLREGYALCTPVLVINFDPVASIDVTGVLLARDRDEKVTIGELLFDAFDPTVTTAVPDTVAEAFDDAVSERVAREDFDTDIVYKEVVVITVLRVVEGVRREVKDTDVVALCRAVPVIVASLDAVPRPPPSTDDRVNLGDGETTDDFDCTTVLFGDLEATDADAEGLGRTDTDVRGEDDSVRDATTVREKILALDVREAA